MVIIKIEVLFRMVILVDFFFFFFSFSPLMNFGFPSGSLEVNSDLLDEDRSASGKRMQNKKELVICILLHSVWVFFF